MYVHYSFGGNKVPMPRYISTLKTDEAVIIKTEEDITEDGDGRRRKRVISATPRTHQNQNLPGGSGLQSSQGSSGIGGESRTVPGIEEISLCDDHIGPTTGEVSTNPSEPQMNGEIAGPKGHQQQMAAVDAFLEDLFSVGLPNGQPDEPPRSSAFLDPIPGPSTSTATTSSWFVGATANDFSLSGTEGQATADSETGNTFQDQSSSSTSNQLPVFDQGSNGEDSGRGSVYTSTTTTSISSTVQTTTITEACLGKSPSPPPAPAQSQPVPSTSTTPDAGISSGEANNDKPKQTAGSTSNKGRRDSGSDSDGDSSDSSLFTEIIVRRPKKGRQTTGGEPTTTTTEKNRPITSASRPTKAKPSCTQRPTTSKQTTSTRKAKISHSPAKKSPEQAKKKTERGGKQRKRRTEPDVDITAVWPFRPRRMPGFSSKVAAASFKIPDNLIAKHFNLAKKNQSSRRRGGSRNS